MVVIIPITSAFHCSTLHEIYSDVRCLKAISIIIITSILCTTGWERFGDDIKLMLGSRPALWWRIMWQGVTPAIVAVSTSPTATAYVNHS